MPPRNIGQPAPRIMQRSMSSGPATTPSASMQADFLGQGVLGPAQDSLGGARATSPKDISASVDSGMPPGRPQQRGAQRT